MSVDLAVVGAPFLDLVFDELPEDARPGQEVVSRALHVAPGGTAMQAIAAARSGASVTLVAPRPDDVFGTLLRERLEAEGVGWVGPRSGATSVTAVLVGPGGTAMVTASGDADPTADDIASVAPRAVVLSLGRLSLAPPGASVYVVTGQVELDHGVSLPAADGARAIIVNEDEATALTGQRSRAASHALAAVASIGIVTLGRDGAVATSGTVDGPATVHVSTSEAVDGDATGAGDVFAGAFAAADVGGADLRAALEHAVSLAGRAAGGATAYEGLRRRDA